MKRLWTVLAENRRFFVGTVLVGLCFSALSILTPTVSGKLVTAVLEGTSELAGLMALYLILSALQISFSLIDQFLGGCLKLRVKRAMRERAFRAFSKKGAAEREEISGFGSFVNNDIPNIAEQYVMGTKDITECVWMLVFSSASLLTVHWILAGIIFTISLLIVFLPRVLRRKSGAAREALSQTMGSYNTGLQSFLGGLPILRAYHYYARANELQERLNRAVARDEATLLHRQLVVYGVTAFLEVMKTVLILVVGIALISAGKMDMGGLVIVLQLSGNISPSIEYLSYDLHSRNEVLPLLARYEKLGETLRKCEKASADKRSKPEKFQTFCLQNVSCRSGETEILRNVSVTFRAGEKILITGESGSGKSTLLRLLARTSALPYEGEIRYNGTEISKVDSGDYYGNVCPVFQEPYLFHATLEENILLGRNISRERYAYVLKRLNLDYLPARCGGAELTPELVERLSGGERQRIALARAMVGEPSVYLLDEVTSALDAANARSIEQLLLSLPATVIEVSHHPNPELEGLYDAHYRMEHGVLKR